MMEVCYSVLSYTVATSHTWLLSTCHMANVMEKLDFRFYLFLIRLNVNSHMWLVATTLYSIALDLTVTRCTEGWRHIK